MLRKIKDEIKEMKKVISISDVLWTLLIPLIGIPVCGGVSFCGCYYLMIASDDWIEFCFRHTFLAMGIVVVLVTIIVGIGFFIMTKVIDEIIGFISKKGDRDEEAGRM